MRWGYRLAVLLLLLFALCPWAAAGSPVLYYIYAPACSSCAKMKAVLGELDAPELRVVEVDLYGEPERASALFERYGVAEAERMAPAVFVGDKVIVDPAEAAASLQGYLDAGEALLTPEEGTGKLAPASALSVWGALAAGLVAGFNPCALSMLLFFLALLLPLGRGATGAAAAFLGAKGCAYLLIGGALIGVFRAWNPAWLSVAAKWLLTVLGAALAALNLLDAWRAWRAEYGDIKNQLPRGMRGFLHRTMKRALADPGGKLLAVAAGLGLVVASTEFLCAGQLYLAALTAAISRGERVAELLLQLVAFSAAFLLPSALAAALVLRGKQAMALSGWMLGKLPLIKLVTALAMIAAIVAAWAI